MDKIEEIKRQNGVAVVRLMSGEVLRVPSALYLERRLRAGQPLDAEAYRDFMRQRGYPHALEAAMKFLALRERSEQEIRARLRRSCYDEAAIDRVVDTLAAHDLVSDRRFAETWVNHRARKYGRGRIARELKMKGVGDQDARAALEALPEEDEYCRALEQAKKMSRRFQDDPKKIAQALMRRGYGWSIAWRAAEEAASSH